MRQQLGAGADVRGLVVASRHENTHRQDQSAYSASSETVRQEIARFDRGTEN
ncbi:MAG: hypothetical protein LC796_05640 [Acidobacteria bacterium]|nr:hypothetical protein [Acidobacteriota bacterium]MCA1610392.1 hypothetical protein [Acidobacteriota bacterium]